MNKYYQQGGEMEQLMQLFQAFADTVQDDEFSTAEEVMQMFQQLSLQEQQQFVQQAMQIVQQEQNEAPQEEQMELEEEPTMQSGGYVNDTGYLEGYETAKNPFNIIKSNRITMKNVDPKIKYIKGTDNLGNTQYMEHGGEYEFDGDFVLEEPVYAQTGKGIKNIDSKYITFNDGSKLELKTYERDYVNKLKDLNTKSFNTDKRREVSETVKLVNDYVNKVKPNSKSNKFLPKDGLFKDIVTNIELNRNKKTELYSPETGIVEDVVNAFGEPFGYKYDKNFFNKKTPVVKPVIPAGMELTEIIDGKNYYSDKQDRRFTTDKSGKLIMIEDVKSLIKPESFSTNKDKPKSTLPSKKLNKKVAEQVATPDVLIPPPVPTEVPEDTFDYRKPLLIDPRFDPYSIPVEEREVNLNPNAFNRTNIGVGKRFFKQYGGATETNFKSRLNPNADINIGAETEQQFYQPYTNKMRLYPNIQLDPVAGQYDSLPMGVNSMNYQAPNAQSRKMFEGKGSNQLLDLSNYASRFGEDNFGMNTQPVSNQTVDRKSKFQEFMDKYGKKSDLEFNPNTNQVAPYYNLMKASEPLAGQYRANVDMRYVETPLLDPLPIVQQLQNQQRLATQNVNTNSPTGQSFISNLNAKLQDKTVEVLNDIQQKNQQITAQNEQARINAYNQEMQLNIAANQQYLQNQMQAQAAKDLAMGEALSTVDQMQANKVKEKNYYNSLAVMTPGLKKNNSFSNIITGTQGYDVDRDFQKLYNAMTQAKTPEEIAAIQKAHQDAINKQKAAVTKQIGGSINQFLKRK